MKLERTLVGTLAASAIAVAGLAGCATGTDATANRQLAAAGQAEPRSVGRTAADATITGKVKAALADDELVKARDIDVDTIRGVVQLNGTVASGAEKERAIALARRVDGVRDVRDNLKTIG